MIGRSAIGQGHAANQRRSRNKLRFLTDSGSSRKKNGPREPYPTDTIDLVGKESEECILPPNRIRKTMDVNINHDNEEHSSGKPGVPTNNFGEV